MSTSDNSRNSDLRRRGVYRRVAALALMGATVVSLTFARIQEQRAAQWRQRALALESQLAAHNMVEGSRTVLRQRPMGTGDYYSADLIDFKGGVTTWHGQGIQVDLGHGKTLEIDLARQKDDTLFLWSPTHQDEDFYHRFIVHPHCANALSLELEKVSLGDRSR